MQQVSSDILAWIWTFVGRLSPNVTLQVTLVCKQWRQICKQKVKYSEFPISRAHFFTTHQRTQCQFQLVGRDRFGNLFGRLGGHSELAFFCDKTRETVMLTPTRKWVTIERKAKQYKLLLVDHTARRNAVLFAIDEKQIDQMHCLGMTYWFHKPIPLLAAACCTADALWVLADCSRGKGHTVLEIDKRSKRITPHVQIRPCPIKSSFPHHLVVTEKSIFILCGDCELVETDRYSGLVRAHLMLQPSTDRRMLWWKESVIFVHWETPEILSFSNAANEPFFQMYCNKHLVYELFIWPEMERNELSLFHFEQYQCEPLADPLSDPFYSGVAIREYVVEHIDERIVSLYSKLKERQPPSAT